MARTTITPQEAAAAYGSAAILTRAAGDKVNGNRYVPGNNDLLLVRNDHDTESGNVVLCAADCIHGRSTNITITCAAGVERNIRVPKHGFKQSDGYVYLDPSALEETYSSHDDGTDVITVGATTAFTASQAVTLTGGTFGGLTMGTTYYVKSPSGATFQLSLTPGGGAIDLTSAVASGTPVFTPASHMKIAVVQF